MGINGENTKMNKSDLFLNICVQYVEDYKFWVLATGNDHRIPEKEIVSEDFCDWAQD